MSIQDLGSIGELIAAIATVGTLGYLAVQVRQNTRALRSSTFQDISSDTSLTSEAIATNPDLARIIIKARDGMSSLTAEERVRYHYMRVMAFRRVESVYVHRLLGAIEVEMTDGFERSAISLLVQGGGAEWWAAAKPAFSERFCAYIDSVLASAELQPFHPGFGRD